VLTLVFLPALYVAWFRIKEPAPREVDSTDVCDGFTGPPKLQSVS
jgi:hypothetical protein